MDPNKTRIVLADDEEGIRETIGALLRLDDCDVLVASDGEEALRLTLEEKPDVLVIDHWMPKLTGIAVAREVARRRVNTGVVLITGDDAADAASSAGVVAVLGKPFTADALEAAISQALDARAAR